MVSRGWEEWGAQRTYKAEAEATKDILLSNRHFWNNCEQLHTISEPIVKLLRLADGPCPCLSKIYKGILDVEAQLRAMVQAESVSNSRIQQILPLLQHRKNMLLRPAHIAAFALDPEFWLEPACKEAEVLEAVLTVVDHLLSDVEQRALAVTQYSAFRNQQGLFSRATVHASAKKMPAWQWWDTLGRAAAPDIAIVAVRLLAQPAAAVACERNWSTFDFIHSRRRNCLTAQRASDLVFVHSNMRLRDKITSVTYEEEFPEWDSSSSDDE